MKSTRLVLASLLVVLAVAALVPWPGEDEPVQTEVRQQPTEAARAPQLPAAAAPSRPVAAPAAPAASGSASEGPSLAAQLAAASDYRVFALAALQRTEQGGAFYASAAADYCYFNRPEVTRLTQATMAEDVRRESTVSSARLAVLGKHASRCANFSPEEAQRIAREAGARKRDGRDPLAALQRAVISSALTTHVVPRELAAALLASSDPLLLSSADLLFMVMRAQPGASEQQGLWFEGKLMPLAELEAGEIVQAVRLASCRDGLPCAMDTEMLIACMQGSVCEEDRVAYVLAYWRAIGGPQESEPRILALAARIRAAIERRDVSTFVAPN